MNEQLFDTIIDGVTRIYDRHFLLHGQTLNISEVWDTDAVYANAWKMEDHRGEEGLIMISGGMARHPDLTPDAFALILCHEVGHHIAGGPMIWRFSAEGQSDYFGASDCLRKLFLRLGDRLPPSRVHAPRVVRKACADAFSLARGRMTCERIALAGASLAGYFARKRGLTSPLFSRPEQQLAKRTLLTPASPQCRLDTYMAAALCNRARLPVDHQGPRWLCRGEVNPAAKRPACWYKADPALVSLFQHH